jgi:hypothetical protein
MLIFEPDNATLMRDAALNLHKLGFDAKGAPDVGTALAKGKTTCRRARRLRWVAKHVNNPEHRRCNLNERDGRLAGRSM